VIEGDEGAAMGAAILAGVGVGAWDSVDSACAEVIKIRDTIEPNGEAATVLEESYERYRSTYPALKPLM
jgi:xylulokinase